MAFTTPQLISASSRSEEVFSAKAEKNVQSDSANADGAFGTTALLGTWTWNGTTTVTATNTSQIQRDDFILQDADGQFFRVASFVVNTSVEILNPDGLTIPSGALASSISDPTVVTLSSNEFLDSLTNSMRFRLKSGTFDEVSALIDTRDTVTQITLQTGFPAVFTNEDWEIIQEDTFMFVAKNPIGGVLRELEVFTVREAIEALGGPFFFNVEPTVIELLQESFTLVSVLTVQNEIIRLYWNRLVGTTSSIVQVDYDTARNRAASPVTVLAFPGTDPFIMDARTTADPNRLYLVYVNPSGFNAYRQSFDLGVNWVNLTSSPGETLIDAEAVSSHTFCEANITDPDGARENVQVLQRRNP